MKSYNFIDAMVAEADSYGSMDMIESHLERGMDLKNLPIQPLYAALKRMTPEKVASYLPRLSKEQRQSFVDIDFWHKDVVDLAHFEFWLQSYSNCADEDIRVEFALNPSLHLYLKGCLNIWTFDVEDPRYPDHNNYFLTDDNLLLFEFSEDYKYAKEVKQHIGDLYSSLGVEHAYACLFKVVTENFSTMLEDEYVVRGNRLRDLGFVDYYDALEIENCYPSLKVMEARLRGKEVCTSEIDVLQENQRLDCVSILPYKDMDEFNEEMSLVRDEMRSKYLQFNFIRLVNAGIVCSGSLKQGSISVSRVGQRTRALLSLGMDYLKSEIMDDEIFADHSLLEVFDFTEIYKVGNSLISFVQRDIKKQLRRFTEMGGEKKFLGNFIGNFLDDSLSSPCSFDDGESVVISKMGRYNSWREWAEFFISYAPFIGVLWKTYKDMMDSGKIKDRDCLNYRVEDIDVEAILLSSFAGYWLGAKDRANGEQRLGLSLGDCRRFFTEIVGEDGRLIGGDRLNDNIIGFISAYGLQQVVGIDIYIREQLEIHLEGNNYKKLEDADFGNVGGPIVMSNLT